MNVLKRFSTLRKERGQILVLSVLILTVLIAMVGLVVDAGFLFAQHRQAQNAADAAALASARRLWEGASIGVANDAAFSYANDNGYDNNGTDNWVEVSFTGGANPTGVEVVIEEEPTSFFIHAVLPGPNRVKARALADTVDIPRDYGLMVLNPTECSGYFHSGNGDVIVNGGSAMINPSCDVALDKDGCSSVFEADGDIDVAGGVEGTCGVDPDPRAYVPWQMEDPLADLEPPYPACLTWVLPCVTRHGSPVTPDTQHITSSVTLEPGVYYGGLLIEGGTGVTVRLEPGIYTMAGGGFTKKGNASIQGDGVLIYVTTNPVDPDGIGEPCPGPIGGGTAPWEPCPFYIEGGGTINLTGPDAPSPYEDIVFWQDEAITEDFHFAGDASGSAGIWYAPGSNLEVTGGANFGTAQVIVDTFSKSGSGDLVIDYNNFIETDLAVVLLVE